MTAAAPQVAAAEDAPFMERFGLAYLRRRAAKLPPVEVDDEIHVLNPEELAALSRIERNVVIRAAIAGALSALLTSVAEMTALPVFGFDPDDTSTAGLLRYWGLVGGVTAVATAAEIGFLYWDSLRSVHQLARAADLVMFGRTHREEASTVATALARAALELPNAPTGAYPIDPMRETSKVALFFAGLLYKLKVGLTSFLLKALLRRLLGRAVLKVYLVLVSIPVTAAWNATVAWWVIRQARLRVIGPSAARELTEKIFTGAPDLSKEARVEALRAVAGSIVRTHDLHPNLVALFSEVHRHVGDPPLEALDDTALFVDRLAALAPREQQIVLEVLAIAVILDGRVSRAERRLVQAAKRACNRTDDLDALRRLRQTFVRGRAIQVEQLKAAVA